MTTRDEAITSMASGGVHPDRARRITEDGSRIGRELLDLEEHGPAGTLLDAIDALTEDELRSTLFAFSSALGGIRRQQRREDNQSFLDALGLRPL